ncbi:MAG: hypothetical protein AAF518_17440 [Spirochaetota bacterium]
MSIFSQNCSSSYYIVKDDKMEVSVSALGNFAIGTVRDGQALDLLFGHPNGKYSNRLGSTFTTIRCNKKDYVFSQLENRKELYLPQKKQITLEGQIPGTKIRIYQRFYFFVGKKDRFILNYGVYNQSEKPVNIGFRVLLDTFSGSNDGVPFSTPGTSREKRVVFDKEVEFTSISSPIWETYDQNNGVVFLRNVMAGNGLTPPDRIVFANWKKAHTTYWEYEIDSQNQVTGDSSVLKWWYPKTILPGKSYEVSTAFEFADKKDGVSLDLQNDTSGFGYLNLHKKNSSAKTLRMNYTIEAPNAEVISPEGSLSFDFPIPPGATLNRTLPLNVSGSGNIVVKVTEDDGKRKKKFSISLNLDKDDKGVSPPIWQNQRKYPVEYLADSKRLQLIAVAMNPKSNTEVARMDMQIKGKRGTKYVYKANIDLRKYAGELLVEVIRKNSDTAQDISTSFRKTGEISEISNGNYFIQLTDTGRKPGEIYYVVDNQKKIARIKLKAISFTQGRAILVSLYDGYEIRKGQIVGRETQ